MSTHPSAEQLSAFLDQELPDAVRLSIEEHLGACDACAAHLAELAAVDGVARALPLEEPAGYFDDFASRVRGRIAARPARRALPVWAWAAAAAVLLAVVTPLAWRERAAQSPAPAVMKDQAAPPAAVPAAPAVPPASAARPQAAPAGTPEKRMTEAERGVSANQGRRANEVEQTDRLLRRDQAVESAPAPELQASQDKREVPAQPEPTLTTPPPARLEEKARVQTGTFAYTSPPPPTSQRQHGPRLEQTVPPPPAAAPAGADSAALGGLDDVRDTDLAKEKDDSLARRKGAATSADGGAAAGGAAEGAKLGATRSVLKAEPAPAQTGDEARRRRETFRRMALEQPEGTTADDARVGTIAEGVRAYRLEGRAEDRATAERDGRAYLARPDALQATRVRALLKELEATTR